MAGHKYTRPPWAEIQALKGTGLSYRELGLHYNVSGSTVQRWVAYYEDLNRADVEQAKDRAAEAVLARCRACRWTAEQKIFHPDWIFYVRHIRLILFDLEQAHRDGLAPLNGDRSKADGANSQ